MEIRLLLPICAGRGLYADAAGWAIWAPPMRQRAGGAFQATRPDHGRASAGRLSVAVGRQRRKLDAGPHRAAGA